MTRSLVIALVALVAAAIAAVQAETAFANGARGPLRPSGSWPVRGWPLGQSRTVQRSARLHMTLTVTDTKTQAYLPGRRGRRGGHWAGERRDHRPLLRQRRIWTTQGSTT